MVTKTSRLPIRYLLALLWAHPILHVSRIRIKWKYVMLYCYILRCTSVGFISKSQTRYIIYCFSRHGLQKCLNHNSRTVELWDSCNGLLDFTAVSVRGCGKIHGSVCLSLSCPAPATSIFMWATSEYGRGCVGGCCSLLLRPCHSLLIRAKLTHVWTKHTKKVEVNGRYASF